MLKYTKYKYLEWRWDRVLKKSGHASWESYLRHNDPDFNIRGYTVRDQFCGYPYVSAVPFKHLDTNFEPLWGSIVSGQHIIKWCEKHCKKKFRWQWERVIMTHNNQYQQNGIAGADELFFGFKDDRDYTLFLLRWS